MTIRINLYFIIMCCCTVSTVWTNDDCEGDTNSIKDDKCFINYTFHSATQFKEKQELNFKLDLDNSDALKKICYKYDKDDSWTVVSKKHYDAIKKGLIEVPVDIAEQSPENIILKLILKSNTNKCKLYKISETYRYRPLDNAFLLTPSFIEASDTAVFCKTISRTGKPTVTVTVKNDEGIELVKDEKIEVSSDTELFAYYFNYLYNNTYINEPGKYYFFFTVKNDHGNVTTTFSKIFSSHQKFFKIDIDVTSTENPSKEECLPEPNNLLVLLCFGLGGLVFILLVITICLCCERSQYHRHLSNLPRNESPQYFTEVLSNDYTSRNELHEYYTQVRDR